MSLLHVRSRWTQLHLIPVLVVVVLLSALVSSQPLPEGACKDRCDEKRPKGQYQPFNLKCVDAYYTNKDIENCYNSCQNCRTNVCDETSSDNPDEWNWVCPEQDFSSNCKTTCTKYRPKGKRESYTLNCNALLTDTEKQQCRDLCTEDRIEKCPDSACQDDTILCPYENMDKICQTQCDKVRNYGDIGPISFDCTQKYGSTGSDLMDCQNSCDKCPLWVCDDGNKYTCPSVKIEGSCLAFCDANRKPTDGNDKFKIGCVSSGTGNTCDGGCNNCNFPQTSPLCDLPNMKNFICPPKDPEGPPPRQAQTSYKGPCKSRCEKGRGGGLKEYELDCGSSRYSTKEEKTECEKDCAACPTNLCDTSGLIKKLRCPEKTHEIDKEKKEKSVEEERMKREKEDLEEYRDREIENKYQETMEAKMATEKAIQNFAIGMSVFFILLICLFVGILIYVYLKIKKENSQIKPEPATQPEMAGIGDESYQGFQEPSPDQKTQVPTDSKSQVEPPPEANPSIQ